MPTASEFATAAKQVKAIVDETPGVHDALIRSVRQSGIRGGTAETKVTEAGGLAAAAAGTFLSRCVALHSTLDTRRQLCEDYTEEFHDYQRRLREWEDAKARADAGDPSASVGVQPTPPNPPFWGAEVG